MNAHPHTELPLPHFSSITNYFKEHRGTHTDCKPFLDMNNAPFVIDSVFISLSLIKGAYHACRGCFLFKCLIHNRSALQTSGYPAVPGYGSSSSQPGYWAGESPTDLITRKYFVFSSNSCITLHWKRHSSPKSNKYLNLSPFSSPSRPSGIL